MDKLFYNSLLYDFYGELLTQKQREVYHMYYCDDMSLAEIGERLNISRQAVNFSIKQAQRSFEDYEAALGLVKSHANLRELASSLRAAIEQKNFAASIDILIKLENII